MIRGTLKETKRLLDVVSQLRRKCPWDRKQTHRSLVRYLVEEAFETVDAIHSGKAQSLREELGDLLLQVVLHAEIASEKKGFGFEDVARGIADKMIRRHPHVFGTEAGAKNLERHSRNWTELKRKERPDKLLLEGIPRALPGLSLSQRYGEIAASVGFDWTSASEVLAKVREEMKELEEELGRRKKNRKAIEMELGDLLFSIANLARHLGLSADDAARKSAAKFGDRFTRMEKRKRREGKTLAECSMEELEAAWQDVKRG